MNSSLRQQVGLEIKLLRNKNGYSLRNFAKMLGISHSSLSKIESGIQSIDIDMLSKIADSFNVSVDFLLNRNRLSNNISKISDNDIQYTLKNISKNYLLATTENFKGHPIAEFIRSQATANIVKAFNLPDFQYRVIGSAGKGRWAEVPWIGIFDVDITVSATEGYYIVYLFKSAGVYLSLNQGWTYFSNKYGSRLGKENITFVREYWRENFKKHLKYFDADRLDLNGRGKLSRGYEAGHILGRYYSFDELSSSEVLVNDIHKIMKIYSQIKTKKSERTIEELNDSILFGIEVDSYYKNEKLINEQLNKYEESSEYEKNHQNRQRLGINLNAAKRAMSNSNYKCEFNNLHETFPTRSSGNNYVEVHHLIPLNRQNKFQNNLDIKPNIIALCPICHRALHYGSSKIVKNILEKFYTEREDVLRESGIEITLEKLLSYYE